MMHTGPSCCSILTDKTSSELFKRVIAITKDHFLDNIVLGFFFEACEADLVAYLDKETKEMMIMALETMKTS